MLPLALETDDLLVHQDRTWSLTGVLLAWHWWSLVPHPGLNFPIIPQLALSPLMSRHHPPPLPSTLDLLSVQVLKTILVRSCGSPVQLSHSWINMVHSALNVE